MTVPTRHHRTTSRSRLGRGLRRAARKAAAATPELAPALAPAEPSEPPEARERLAGGPQDRALYHCHCGFIFEDAVTTSVGCPHCGSAQAW